MPIRQPSTALILQREEIKAIDRELYDLDREEIRLGTRLLAIEARRKTLASQRKRLLD